MKQVKLSTYTNQHYKSGSTIKKLLWYFTNMIFFKTLVPFPSSFKVKLLRLFGAIIGKNINIKPNVNIKYPWFLEIGSDVWIGESVWIDNLAKVTIGNDVCLSQDAYLLTGSHNYKKSSFDLILGEIILEDGVWIGAMAIVCPSITCKRNSVLSAGSVATSDLNEDTIYQGNPAVQKRSRIIG